MKAIPAELYEAAAVDGASVLQRFRHVTLPGHPEHHDHRGAAVDHLDLQRLRRSSTSSPRAGRAAPPWCCPCFTYEIAFGAQRLGEAIAVALYMLPRAGLRRSSCWRATCAGAGAMSVPASGAACGGRAPVERASGPVRGVLRDPADARSVVLFPFYWMTITSFKSEDQMRSLVVDVLAEPVRHRELPPAPREDRLRRLVRQQRRRVGEQHAPGHGHRHHRRLRAGPAAVPRARRSWRAPSLITYLVPPSILFIPLYAQIRNLGLADSLTGLIAAYPSFTVPFVTWLLMGYFESIPEELEEAAMIDGATRFGAFCRIVLPLAAPGVLAAGALRLHPGVERVPLRAGVHHRREAAHAARSGCRASSPATCTAGAISWRARC